MVFVYGHISRAYIDQVHLHSLVATGLNQLVQLDPDLGVQDQGANFSIAYKGAPIAQLDPPANSENPRGWGRFAATGAALAKFISPKLSEMTKEDILSALLNPALQSLDPYTRYLSPAQAKAEQAARRGFGGIGVILDTERSGLIHNILEESPAAKAGILPGDRILRVGETAVAPLSPQQLIALLQGEVGSIVTVTFQRASATPFIRNLTRQKLFQNSVRARSDENGVVTLKLTAFNDGTLEEFKAEIKKHIKIKPIRGMILDLRDNLGGTFQTALDIADLFLTKGSIVSTRNRRGVAHETMAKSGNEIIAQTVPMVVLINGQTASASEVLASALQDRGRAIVVGSGSFGKGLVQTVYENLPNQGELILTTLHLHPPLGYSLHRYGVIPTVCTARQMDQPQAADQLASEIRSPGFHPEVVLAARRTADRATEAERTALSALCPPSAMPRTHDIDQKVAELLLADPSLYARALPAPALASRR